MRCSLPALVLVTLPGNPTRQAVFPPSERGLQGRGRRLFHRICTAAPNLNLTLMAFCCLQGLFRIGAGASKLKKLKAALDCSTSHLDEFYSDPHAVAGEPQGVALRVGGRSHLRQSISQKSSSGGVWVAQSVKHPTLDLSSGHDPRVRRSSPALGSVLSVEPT